MINSLVADFFNTICDLLVFIVNLVFAPINALFETFMPDNVQMLYDNVNNFLVTFLTFPVGFFTSLIPPVTYQLLLTSLNLLIIYYSIRYTYKAIVIIPHIIKRIKFW